MLCASGGLRVGDAVMFSKKSIAKDRKGYSLAIRTEKTGAAVTCPLPNDVARDVLAIGNKDYPFWTGKKRRRGLRGSLEEVVFEAIQAGWRAWPSAPIQAYLC